MSTVPSPRVLLFDHDAHTARALALRFLANGQPAPAWVPDSQALQAAMDAAAYDTLIFDFHADRPEDLEACTCAKLLDPSLPVLALCAPGPALKFLTEWNAPRGAVDQVISKPLSGPALFQSLAMLVERKRTLERASRLASLVAEEGRSWADTEGPRPVVSEAAILFTDLRRSSALAARLTPPQLFDQINRSLSAQGAIVRQWQGSIVKFTGDGVLAAFRGRGRAHYALRCAMALQEADLLEGAAGNVRIGIGAAEGLVMSGLIGEPGNQQFDVVGATVHLAARLCSIAQEGEAVVTPKLLRAAGMQVAGAQARTAHLRGFRRPVDCVSFIHNAVPLPSSHETDEAALQS